MWDLLFAGLLDFNATSVTVSALSPSGRRFLAERFGEGAASVDMPKSEADKLHLFATRHCVRVRL